MAETNEGPRPRPSPSSAGEAAKAVTEDVQRLVRAEVELAKAEIKGQVAARGVAIGLLGTAGVLGVFLLYWLIYAVFAAWSTSFSAWAAALLTAAVLAATVGLLGVIAGAILRRPITPPERAKAAAQQTQEMVKSKLGR